MIARADRYDRRGLQWARVVEVTLTEGERRLPMARLRGLRAEFEFADSLGAFPRSAAEAEAWHRALQRPR